MGPYSGDPSVRQKPINGSAFRWGVGPSLAGDSILVSLPSRIPNTQGPLPNLVHQDQKVVFVFEANDSFYRDLSDYNCGALIEASKFAMAIKALKSQIISLKMDKGQRSEEKEGIGISYPPSYPLRGVS